MPGGPSSPVARRRWAASCSAATAAGTSSGCSTPAATGIARSARRRARDAWRAARLAELLPVPYCHLVFTLPHALNGLAAVPSPLGVPHADAVRGGHAQRVRRQPPLAGRHRRLHAGAAHLDAGPAPAHPRARADGLRGAALGTRARPLVRAQAQPDVPVPGARTVQGVPGQVPRRAAPGDAGRRVAARSGRTEARTPAAAASSCCVTTGWSMPRRRWPGPAVVLDYLSRYTHRMAICNERLVGIDGDGVRLRVRADDQRRQANASSSTGRRSSSASCSMCCRRASSASGTTGCSARRSSPSGWRRRARLLGMPAANPQAREDAQAFMRRVAAIDIARCPHCQAGRWQLLQERRADRQALADAVPTPCRGPP